MTPEERERITFELFQEYQEKLACLAILDRKIQDFGEHLLLPFARRLVARESLGGGLADVFDGMVALDTLITDYRATYGRCESLRGALASGGYAESVSEIPYERR